jgi:ATP/maltotriose-dependent transcriptional regulator MalT
MGHHDEAEALLAQTGSRGLGSCAATPPAMRAEIATRTGDFGEAERLLAITDQLTAQLADVQFRAAYHMRVAELELLRGRPADAYEQVERALAIAAGSDDELYMPEMCALAVRALADQLDEARATGRRVDTDKMRLLAANHVDDAERLAAAPVARGGTCSPRVRALVSMAVAERSRLHQSDPALWREATDRWAVVGEPYPTAYCHWREAEALLAGRAGRARATECLQQAWRISLDLGTVPLTERIEGLARRARIAPPDAVDHPTVDASTVGSDLGLTPREVEVLGLLAAGRTDREISESLFISKKTASVHVSNLLRKLDVANRVEAGRIGQDHGLG